MSDGVLYSEQAEKAALGLVLADGRQMVDLRALLTQDDLFLLRHRFIYEAMTRIVERGQAVDLLSVAEELEKQKRSADVTVEYLAELIGAPASEALATYAAIVTEKAYRRRLLAAADAIKVLATDEAKERASVASGVEAALDNAAGLLRDREITSLSTLVSEYFNDVEASADAPDAPTGITTGFKDLDHLWDGIQPATLTYVGGRPGMGKTSFMLAMALAAARAGRSVYLWTGEMSVQQLRERLVSMETQIPSRLLRRGLRPGGMTDAQWATFVKVAGDLHGKPIYLDDIASISPPLLEERTRRLKRTLGGLDVIMIDYINLMSGGAKHENREKELASISRKLKALSRAVAPVICAAQLSRATETRTNNRPMLSDLRDSGGLEQDADIVAFLYRDEVYSDTAAPGLAEVITAKNRSGAVGTINLAFEREYTLFKNVTVKTVNLQEVANRGY